MPAACDKRLQFLQTILPAIKDIEILTERLVSNEEISIQLRDAQYLPIPGTYVKLHWAISQIESSLLILSKDPNNPLEHLWLTDLFTIFNESMMALPIPQKMKFFQQAQSLMKKKYPNKYSKMQFADRIFRMKRNLAAFTKK